VSLLRWLAALLSPQPWPIIRNTPFATDVTITGVTEKVLCTIVVSTQTPDQPVRLHGWAQITPGSDQTSIALAIRRGTTISGTLTGEANAQTFSAAASQVLNFAVETTDTPGEVASQAYVLTALQAGGVVNGTAVQGNLRAIVG